MVQKGYEIKSSEIDGDTHKYIAFRAPGQERWICGREKTLGPEYTKQRIKERVEEKARICAERMKKLTARRPSMIDTSQEKFADRPGLKKRADRQHLKAAAQIQSKPAEIGFHFKLSTLKKCRINQYFELKYGVVN